MARVYLARVDDRTPEDLAAAVERARGWLGKPTLTGDVCAVAAPRWGRLSRRDLERRLRGLTGRGDERIAILGRRGDTFRYQLSVGTDRRHDRLSARVELYRIEGLVLAPSLSLDVIAGGPGGADLWSPTGRRGAKARGGLCNGLDGDWDGQIDGGVGAQLCRDSVELRTGRRVCGRRVRASGLPGGDLERG